MNKEGLGKEAFEQLWDVYSSSEETLLNRYRQMREILERLCCTLMQNESLQMTDLAARISFLAAKYNLDLKQQNLLHTFRLTSNRVLNRQELPTEELYFRDMRILAFTIRKLCGQDIPFALLQVLPKSIVAMPIAKRKEKETVKRLRVCFQWADDNFLYVVPLDAFSNELLKIRYRVKGMNEEFSATVERLWQHAQLNLLDASVDEEGIYTPAFIVLEPDYLLDISSLAECFKDYGSHPANYNLSKLVPISNARPLLLGNIANLFLDEWIHANGEVDYKACMQKAFKNYPIEIAACEDLKDKEKEQQFFDDCKMHFEHIREVVTETFHASGYDLNKEDAVLEPSYICEALGIQGRLDYMQRDMSSFIEMKSGKADEFAIRGKVEPKENNKVQMLLYMAVLEYSMGQNHKKMRPYLLYTRYPLLYPARPVWNLVKKAINVRNLIVANEYGVQLHNNQAYTSGILAEIQPKMMNEKSLHGKYWEQYLKPSIENYGKHYAEMSTLEQSYYITLFNFITKEQYTAKSGDTEHDGRVGTAALWLSTLQEKCEAGEILYDLKIIDNRASDKHKASLTLSIPTYGDDFLPNFRAGDVVVLYERNCDEDKVTNKLVFKGSIDYITTNELKIRIRATQQNISVFAPNSLYAVEHDSMDTTFRTMYQGLHSFAVANKDRRDLLLSQRLPDFDPSFEQRIKEATNDFERIALKAEAAKDYFLLIGPPGTGKTSHALKRMVETSYAQPQTQLLLLAYTNRAVDEICKSLSTIYPKVDYIRVGSELSCDEVFRSHLIENELSSCLNRSQVYARISKCRVFVGTVASISNKPELFRLKSFSVAIVDEATQILEPQLLGILCAKDNRGNNAVGKFILIGDHKQLPAVVLQSKEQSCVQNELLNEVGLFNLRDSLFERLYRTNTYTEQSKVVDMLCKQGRMNPEVALFPNNTFYGGKLEIVGLPHQLELWDDVSPEGDSLDRLMNKRIAFIPSEAERKGGYGKTNSYEAKMAAKLAMKVYERYREDFDTTKTLGIITPYRSQIALIKKEISYYNVPLLNEIAVDTVERFQGSERDVIIYSFSVNYVYQLKFLVNIMEEAGVLIDRKLNVALTRARKQLFLIGVPEILQTDSIYRNLLKMIKD